jgi:transcription elongation factor GreA
MSRIPLTQAGAEQLRAELDRLKRVERPAVIEAIAEARAHGDLKENAEYHAARDQQGLMEARINQLEGALSHAQIIDVSSLDAGDRVVFGASVTIIEDAPESEEITWQIVGDLEADAKAGKLGVSAPLARALIGKEVGDEVQFEAPGGQRHYEIIEVVYGS